MTIGTLSRFSPRRVGQSLLALACCVSLTTRAQTPPAKPAANDKPAAADKKPAAEQPTPAPGGGDGSVYPPAGVGLGGAVGINRITSAYAGRAGSLRLGLRGGLFQMNKFPTAGMNRMLYGELTGGYTLRPGIELFAAIRNSSNSNNATSPSVIQSMGDFLIGTKIGWDLGSTQLAGDIRFDAKAGTGSDYLNFRNSTVQIRALSSTAFKLGNEAFEFHANAGGILGRSLEAVDERMTPEKLFGTGLSGYHRVVGGIALQYQAGRVNPYISFDLDVPLGVSGTNLKAANTSTLGAATKRGALGARIQISPALGAIDLAAELGTGKGVTGFARTQPWMVFAAYSVAFDSSLYAAPPPAPPPPPPAPTPVTGELRGVIIDPATKLPVKGAVVSIDGISPVATGADGVFLASKVKPGPITIRVEREGYKPATGSANVTAGSEASTQLTMEALPPPPPPAPVMPLAPPPPPPAGYIAGQIRSGRTGVQGVVRVLNINKEFRTSVDGSFSLKLSPGRYDLLLLADGHFARAAAATVHVDEAAAVVVTTSLRPAVATARVEGDKLTLTKPIVLDETRVELAADEVNVMAEIADILARDPSKKVIIEVHSDQPKKDKSDRSEWTGARAAAIRQALIDQGVPSERVEAAGFGITKPVVPLTAKDAARNRRVEFNVASMPVKKVVPVAPSTATLPAPTLSPTPTTIAPAPATTTPAPKVAAPAPATTAPAPKAAAVTDDFGAMLPAD